MGRRGRNGLVITQTEYHRRASPFTMLIKSNTKSRAFTDPPLWVDPMVISPTWTRLLVPNCPLVCLHIRWSTVASYANCKSNSEGDLYCWRMMEICNPRIIINNSLKQVQLCPECTSYRSYRSFTKLFAFLILPLLLSVIWELWFKLHFRVQTDEFWQPDECRHFNKLLKRGIAWLK